MPSDGSSDGTERTARYSDPITERGRLVGRGAVLYDTRDPHARPCCARPDGRCLAHVVGVYEETTTGEVYYKVVDGTWTTEEWIHGDDLLALFEPAGWSVTSVKPTYLLTRDHGVDDHHDVMTDGGTVEDGFERDPLEVIDDRIDYLENYTPRDASHKQRLEERKADLEMVRRQIVGDRYGGESE